MGAVSVRERPYAEVWQEGKKLYELNLVIFSFAMDICLVSQAVFSIMDSNSDSDKKEMFVRNIVCLGTLYSTSKCLPIYDRKFQWIRNLEYPYTDAIRLPTSEEIQSVRRLSPGINEEAIQCYRDAFLGFFALIFQPKWMSGGLFTRAISQAITMSEGPELLFIDIIRQQDEHKKRCSSRCTRINQRVVAIGRTIWGAVSGFFQRRGREHRS